MTPSSENGSLILHYGSGESWTTAVHLRRAASRRTRVWDASHRKHRRLDAVGSKDHYLWVESGLSSYPLDSHRAHCTTAGYLIDTHRHPSLSLHQAMLFDVVFVAQRSDTSSLSVHHPNVRWLPLAAPQSFLQLPRERRYDIAFVGKTKGLPERARLLNTLAQRFVMNDWWRFHSPDEMAAVYSQSRIVINLPVSGDLNMRFFEAMAAGATLLQPPMANSSGVRLIAAPGKHYMESDVFADPRHLAMEIAGLLNTDRPERIGEAARELIREAHTYDHRLATVEAVLQGRTPRRAPIRSYRRCQRRRYWAAVARRTADVRLLQYLLQEFPEAAFRHPLYLGGTLLSASRRGLAAQSS